MNRFSILHNPSRLLLEIPNSTISLDSSSFKNYINIDGCVADSVFIPVNDESGSWSSLLIHLKYSWDEIECSLSGIVDVADNYADSPSALSIILKPIVKDKNNQG
jgi:hypothetical protein